MQIDVLSDETIGAQARTYAEYRVFAAVTRLVNRDAVRTAQIVLRHGGLEPAADGAECAITVSGEGLMLRVRASDAHIYAAINRAVERLGAFSGAPASLGREA
jgi:ribosome-associated translation inhibitor RaiA